MRDLCKIKSLLFFLFWFCFKEGELIEKSSHPTAMMLISTVNLLKTLALSAGIYAEVLQTDALRTLCGLLRMLVESGVNDKSSNLILVNLWLLFVARDWASFNLTVFCCQVVILTDWCLGSSTGVGVLWASFAALLFCHRCAALLAPLLGLACSSE